MNFLSPHFLADLQRFQHDGLSTGRYSVNYGQESSEFTILVKHIPATTNRLAIIEFAEQFGTLAIEPHITQTSG